MRKGSVAQRLALLAPEIVERLWQARQPPELTAQALGIPTAKFAGQVTEVREGLDETLTVMGLGLPENLERVLSSTNLIVLPA